jgi:hypothetical protein
LPYDGDKGEKDQFPARGELTPGSGSTAEAGHEKYAVPSEEAEVGE